MQHQLFTLSWIKFHSSMTRFKLCPLVQVISSPTWHLGLLHFAIYIIPPLDHFSIIAGLPHRAHTFNFSIPSLPPLFVSAGIAAPGGPC